MIELQDNVRIDVNQDDLDRLDQRYGERLVRRVTSSMLYFTKKTEGAAKDILTRKKHRDTGRLIKSITPHVEPYSKGVIRGEVNAGELYARFIHEGARHRGGRITPHFVPFRVAPTLRKWAERHSKLRSRRGKWYFVDSKGNEHVTNLQTGGLMVHQQPTKFFSGPFESHLRRDFIKEMNQIIKEL